MRDPNPANSTWTAPPSPPRYTEGMRRPRPSADWDDDMQTLKRGYVPPDDQELDAALPLLSASDALQQSPMGASTVDGSWIQALNAVLFDAVQNLQPQSVSMLLDRGADVNASDPLSGDTPLIVAMDNGYWSMMELLLARGAEPNFADPFTGNTPLMVAIYERNWTAAALLVANGADEDFANPYSGLTAWMIAQEQGDAVLLSPMLARCQFRGDDAGTPDRTASPHLSPMDAADHDDAPLCLGAVVMCDTDGSHMVQTMGEMEPGAEITGGYQAANNVSAATDPTGLFSPGMLAVLSGPWHTD